ncbi:MAG TPA: hypothetical protein VL171_00800 [Verrucomicrobiae bacterium]|nr:hypothetical protein [Verrucomicrobiae bacterium]
MDVYFSDVFGVSEADLKKHGAFNISLVTDLPLFIDPFLLFNSKKTEYQQLHDAIIEYLAFLRDEVSTGTVPSGLLKALFRFSEVKQNWFGFTAASNTGRGLGMNFASALQANLHRIFADFGNERITQGSHLEKLCLIEKNVGKDMISDFTTNLVKEYLLTYTQTFACKHIHRSLRKTVSVARVRFNYQTKTWESGQYDLPWFENDYVLLTPIDLLTKDDTWINRTDLVRDYDHIPDAVDNDQLRAQINHYFLSVLPKKPRKKDRDAAIIKTILKFPELIDYFIKYKEDNGDKAKRRSIEHVNLSIALYVEQFRQIIELLAHHTAFYTTGFSTEEETRKRILFLKDVIENKGGWRVFYRNGEPIAKEEDIQILYRLTWYASPLDVSREVNDGRGPVDFKISHGARDKTLVEMKLASNSQLERNLARQLEIYQRASDAPKGFKVIVYFSESELRKVGRILKKLKLGEAQNVYVIDACKQTKTSASKA